MFGMGEIYYPDAVRKRHVIALLWIFGIVAIGLAIHLRGPSEPSYRGRTLSDWIVVTRVHPDDEEARMVVRQLASNLIPLLLDWIKREDRPTPRARIVAARDGAITFLERHRVIKPQPHCVARTLCISRRFGFQLSYVLASYLWEMLTTLPIEDLISSQISHYGQVEFSADYLSTFRQDLEDYLSTSSSLPFSLVHQMEFPFKQESKENEQLPARPPADHDLCDALTSAT